MFDVRRYLSLDPWTGLVVMISDRTYQNLVPTHCELVSLEAQGGLATRVTIRTHRSTSSANLLPPLEPELTYTYDRLDPDVFFRTELEPVVIDVLRAPTTSRELLAVISQRTGIVFDHDDFEHQEITDYGVVQLHTTERSLRWVGQLTLVLTSGASVPLADALVVKTSDSVFRMLSTSAGRTVDFVYAAEHDFTPFRYDLIALLDSPNGLTPQRLSLVLQKVTGDPWVLQNTPSAFNYCVGMEDGMPVYRILYAGPPTLRYTPRKDKSSIIVLEIDETRCTALSGRLLLHYD